MANVNKKNGEIDQSAEINQLLSDMCMKVEHADVTFIVDGTKIPAHKTILSARNSYFNSMFGGDFAEAKQDKIKLDVPLIAFKAILKYIYTGCLSLAEFKWNEQIEMYDLANQYGFDSLKEILLEFLTANLALENCVAILNTAHLYSMDELQNSCLIFMDVNSTELLGHDTFKDLPISFLCTLLKRDTFYAPEVDIFNAICKWYKSNPDADIKEALSTVRWSKLNSDELINIIFGCKILDQAELLKLMKGNLNDTTDHIPSPVKYAGKNVATSEFGAKTISGENPSALLDGNFTEYGYNTGCTFHSMESGNMYHDRETRQKIEQSSIVVDLGDVKPINYIEMLLMDKDDRSYSYYVAVSLDGTFYERLFDYTEPYRRSWQTLFFESRPVRFIKLVGTQAINLKNKRTGYAYNNNGSYYGNRSCDYNSFDIVNLKAMYKTTNIPKLIDGAIVPTKNVATLECGANVVQGYGGNNMLNVKLGDFTYHRNDSFILLQLSQPYVIDSLRMLLGDGLNPSNKYSFCIETSLNKTDWGMAVDKREEALTGWQEFDFTPRRTIFIKITGTQSDNDFICTYFECVREPQKPRLERTHV